MLKARDWKGNIIGNKGGNIDFIECSWDRKLNEHGEFMVYLSLDEYNKLNKEGFKYVENVGRPELGIIQKTEYERKTEGGFVTVEGFFIDSLLDYAKYRKKYTINTTNATNTKSKFTDFLNKANEAVAGTPPLGEITISTNSVFPDSVDLSIEECTEAGAALYDILGEQYGYNCTISHYPQSENDPLKIEINTFKGKDLTSGDDSVYLGKAYNNVSQITYTLDESSNKCLYEVIQDVNEEQYPSFSTSIFPIKYKEKTDDNYTYSIGCYFTFNSNRPSNIGNCMPKEILNVSLSSDDVNLEDTSTSNQNKIKKLMETEATLDMLNNYRIETITCKIIQEKFIYLQDYDLGDKCNVYIDDLDLMFTAVIAEIEETHKSNQIEIDVVLGTPKKKRG